MKTKLKEFWRHLFDHPLDKLDKLAYVFVAVMFICGMGMQLLTLYMQTVLFGSDFGDVFQGLFAGIIFGLIYAFFGWVVGLLLRCYTLFIRNHMRQADAIERQADATGRMASCIEQLIPVESDMSDESDIPDGITEAMTDA